MCGLSLPRHLLICTALNSIFCKGVVRIAVQPALARLPRSNHGMPTLVRVFSGVPVRRTVAAERDAACLAGPQMNPVVADLHAFFAFAALRLFDRCDRVEMRTASLRHCSIFAALDEWNQPRSTGTQWALANERTSTRRKDRTRRARIGVGSKLSFVGSRERVARSPMHKPT